jgi:hypothetical protein
MSVPYIFSTVPGGTSIPLSELDANFAYLSGSPSLTSLSLTGNLTVSGISTFTGLITANGGLTLTGALNLNGLIGSNNQVVYSNAGLPSWTFISPAMLTTGAPSWDALGNLTTIGNVVSGTGAFKSALSPASQILLGTNNFSVYLNSIDYFNVSPSQTTIPNNLLVTGSSSTFNNLVTALSGLSVNGSLKINGTTGSSNNVLLINGGTPTWAPVGPSYLTTGAPTWDGSGNVSAILGFGAGNGTFYNTGASNCYYSTTITGATTSVNGSNVFTVDNLGNANVLNNLIVGGTFSSNGTINTNGALTVSGNITSKGSISAVSDITSSANITATNVLQGASVISTTGVFGLSTTGTQKFTLNSDGSNGIKTSSGSVTITSTGDMQLNAGATAYSIVGAAGYTGQLGIYFGMAPTPSGAFVYQMGTSQLNLQIDGGNKLVIDSSGNTTASGKLESATGIFANSVTTTNFLSLQTTNATISVNGVNTIVSSNLGSVISGFVSSSTGNFVNSSSSATSQLSVNTTAFTATVNGVAVSQILANGNMTITGTLTQGSDVKLKTNITNIEAADAIAKVRQLQGVLYKLKSDPDGPKYLGLIADDVQKVLPEAVIESDISGAQDGSNIIKSVAYSNMIGLLVEAIKEIDARLTAKGI